MSAIVDACPEFASPSTAASPATARDTLDVLAAAAWQLEPPPPHERRSVLRDEAAALVDGLLARVARSGGALDVAIGEGLAALAEGDRVIRLGYSGIGDYARERLGIVASTAQKMARLARELRDRPLLKAAVRRGEVSARKAQAVLPVARGEDEAGWVARARAETVRALQAAARSAKAASGAAAENEEWERVAVAMTPDGRAKLEEAMALAGRLLGASAPRWQRLEAICQEYLASHPVEPSEDEAEEAGALHRPIAGWLEAAKEGLEVETELWAALKHIDPVAAAGLDCEGRVDPLRLGAELERLAGMRDRWDELVGHLAMLLRMMGLWRELGFADLGHYCAERLGISERAVEQRASLAKKLHELPALRDAMRKGRLTYEKARLVAGCADGDTIETWIGRAERTTCIALRREIEAVEEAQMCARGELVIRVPRRVGLLVDAVVRAAREATNEQLTPGESLALAATHFIETWSKALKVRSTAHRRVLDRDRGCCQVPGCSRPAVHAHHILHRAQGGDDDPRNLVGLCAVHHLQGVHRGFIRVWGRAPDGLRWELAVPPRGLLPEVGWESACAVLH